MFISRFEECEEILANDKVRLRELLSPHVSDVEARYSLAHAILEPGLESLPHRMKTSEVYYVLAGRGLMVIDDEEAEVSPGDTIYIPPGSKQWIANTGEQDLVFLCIVDPAWKVEDELII